MVSFSFLNDSLFLEEAQWISRVYGLMTSITMIWYNLLLQWFEISRAVGIPE